MIGVEIKKLRKLSGLTLEAFAEAVGVSFQSIINWEQNIHKPNKVGLAKLKKYMEKREKKLNQTKVISVKKPKAIKKNKKKK